MPVRIGLIGCGNVGVRVHLPALGATAGIEVGAAADPTPERLAAAAEAARLAPADLHADWRDLLARPDVDAVVVATPQRFRPEIAVAAAEAGKHLLCEKPLALAPAEATRIVEAARSSGVTLAVVHNYLFMPAYRAIKDALAGGEVGSPEVAILTYLGVEDRPGAEAYRPRWRHTLAEAGGGVLMDMLHIVYLAHWFMGQQPIAVSAAIDRRLPGDGEIEDVALVRYDYPSGHALVNMAWGVGPGGVEVAATKGRIVMVNQGYATHPFVPADRVVVIGEGGEREIVPDEPAFYGMAGVAADFRDAVAAGRPPAADGAAGLLVLESVVGAYAAGALGRRVSLPLAPGDAVYELGAAGIARLDLPAASPFRRMGLFGV